MPELPEVEVIKLGLQKRIIGLKITKIQINSHKSFMGNPNKIEGQKVLKIERRAKLLMIELDGISLLFHLKMSGQLVWKGERFTLRGNRAKEDTEGRFIGGHPTADMVGKMPNSHTRVIFSFSNGSHLYFNDQRRFGWVKAIQGDQGNLGILGNLGPEPLEKDFTWEVLKKNLLKHKSMPVKVAIMDQQVVSGVGNIYANEACFLAKIDPRVKVKDLVDRGDKGDRGFKALHQGIVKALMEGIKHGGSTRAHFVDSEGHKGYFLDYTFVYGRDKHKCKKCGTDIKKVQLGGRGTYFCPNCQN